MPYDTRRKSLSLPLLGIQLPRGPRPARSPPSVDPRHSPPAKRVKRTHSTSTSSSTVSTPATTPLALRIDDAQKGSGRAAAHTPPPSPGAASTAHTTKVDTQGIDDTIVIAVIERLERTGNRPHLLKELAAVLSSTIPIVESSANPAAIISSRLATYLKRGWTALSRCPLDKKLVGTHPKRVYYFLATCPHQPIPANVDPAARIITPSLSSATSEEEEDLESRSRDRMSPSPELDLSTPDYDDGTDPFSNAAHPPTSANISHNRRAQSPPLEKEEREFKMTVTSLQQRRKSQEAEFKRESLPPTAEAAQTDVIMDESPEAVEEETEECAARKNSEAAAALFGNDDGVVPAYAVGLGFSGPGLAPSSPILRPVSSSLALESMAPPPIFRPGEVRLDLRDLDWSLHEMKSPENVELHELDDLLDGC